MRLPKLSMFAFLMVLVSTLSGCSLCCSPYLDDYAAYGSRTPRMDMKNGRVGSVFSDPQLMGLTTTTTHSDDSVHVETISQFDWDENDAILDDSAIELVGEDDTSSIELDSVE